jgi:hypothetical protein
MYKRELFRPFQYIGFPKFREKTRLHKRQNFDSLSARNESEFIFRSFESYGYEPVEITRTIHIV